MSDDPTARAIAADWRPQRPGRRAPAGHRGPAGGARLGRHPGRRGSHRRQRRLRPQRRRGRRPRRASRGAGEGVRRRRGSGRGAPDNGCPAQQHGRPPGDTGGRAAAAPGPARAVQERQERPLHQGAGAGDPRQPRGASRPSSPWPPASATPSSRRTCCGWTAQPCSTSRCSSASGSSTGCSRRRNWSGSRRSCRGRPTRSWARGERSASTTSATGPPTAGTSPGRRTRTGPWCPLSRGQAALPGHPPPAADRGEHRPGTNIGRASPNVGRRALR